MVQKFRLELGHEVGLFAPAFLIGVALVKSGNAKVRVQADTALGEVPNLALQMLTFMTFRPFGQTTRANRNWAIRTLHPAGMTLSVDPPEADALLRFRHHDGNVTPLIGIVSQFAHR